MTRSLTIADKTITDTSDAYVIAELGHNHQGRVDTCLELVQAAKDAGCDAVKLQKRSNKKLFTAAYYNSPYVSDASYGATYGEHREALELDAAGYREAKAFAESIGIHFFATAFDQWSVDFLALLGVPAIKIASGDLTNTPLLAYAAHVGVPLIVSTGASNADDVERAYNTLTKAGAQFALLQCTAEYPADPANLNLDVILSYRFRYPNTVVGLSSHVSGLWECPPAYVMGARIFEKHFTLNRAMKGSDHRFSMEPAGMRKLVRDLRRTRLAMGDGTKRRLDVEQPAITKMGKRLYAAIPIRAGHVLTEADVAIKSPGGYPEPYKLSKYIGKVLTRDVDADEAMCSTGEVMEQVIV